MTAKKKWKILQSQFAFHHRWYKVRQDIVELPNGNVIDDYFVSVRPDIALVLPITRNHEIVFVRQYRHGVGEVLIELPAGAFDPAHEDAETAARREFEEETGYRAERLLALGALYDNPVKETNKIHLFLAQDAHLVGEQQLDVTEDIEVVLIPISEVAERILQGELQVAGSVAALFLGLKHLGILTFNGQGD
ncbi:MAG: NUDIX hydrolase [Leptolyngbyaceae cyanobacterium MO_188.B28]|nr:NUDIX hydrolase [Leptolyngbyaceae cyanobacterium MO_188.B28]